VLFWRRRPLVNDKKELQLAASVLCGLNDRWTERTTNTPPKDIFTRNSLGFFACDNLGKRLARFNSRLTKGASIIGSRRSLAGTKAVQFRFS
jgi:hypothetical protein